MDEDKRNEQGSEQLRNPYVDSVKMTEADKKRSEAIKENAVTPSQRRAIWTLTACCVITIAVVAAYLLIITGNGDVIGAPTTVPENTEDYMLYEQEAYCGELTTKLPQTEYPEGIQDRFKPLYAANTDFVGWISIPGTPVDFPVTQYPNTPYDYYLRRKFYGNYSHYGDIFMDYRCTYSPFCKNTIVYGHHFINDDLYFACLENYQDVEYYKEHPIIEFDTLKTDYTWKICAAFRINTEGGDDNGYVFDYIYPFMSDTNFVEFMSDVKKRSYFVNDAVDILPTDNILTLSTCTYIYGVSREWRFVVIARQVRPGETAAVDTSGAVSNQNPKMPQYHYSYNGISNPYANDKKWYPSYN